MDVNCTSVHTDLAAHSGTISIVERRRVGMNVLPGGIICGLGEGNILTVLSNEPS